MSDYDSFDSFDSGSDSESPPAIEFSQDASTRALQARGGHISKDEISGPLPAQLMSVQWYASGKGGELPSDQDELEGSTSSHPGNTLKAERSPKPRRKLKMKKPTISGFTNIIMNRLRKDVAVFGVSLEMAIQRSQLGMDGVELPTVFRECIDYLEELGMEHEGLYRLPGVKSRVEDAKSRYDKGEVVDLKEYDPNVVASLLKQYLRELPEPLLPPRVIGKCESTTQQPGIEQLPILEEAMEEVPAPNKLLLSWLLTHIAHLAEKSVINKMTLPNLVIVFSPTLQVPASTLHLLYNNAPELFGKVELTRYERMTPPARKYIPVVDVKQLDTLDTEEEIDAELERLGEALTKLHKKMAGKLDERDKYCWELQRGITELRRKRKAMQKASRSRRDDEDDFLKTLTLIEATLIAENEVLVSRKQELQAAVKYEAELVDTYKEQLLKHPPRSEEPTTSEEESGDDEELAKKIAALRWHGKEMELRNRNIIKSIQEEEEAIMQLKVELKVLPLKQQQLNTNSS